MRICFLAAAASVNTQSWLLSLKQRNHEVHIITFHDAEIEGVNVHYIESKISLFKINYLLSIPKVKRLLSQIQPDLVIGYYIASYGVVASMTGSHPLVLAAAGGDILDWELYGNSPFRMFFDKIMLNYSLRKADFVFSWARHMTQRLIELGADKEKVATFPRGIDTTLFYPRISTDDDIGDKIRIISTRSFEKIIKFNVLVNALDLTIQKGMDIECIFLGDGPKKNQVRELVESLGLSDKVKFLGVVEYNEVADYLRESDIYVAVALSDGASASLFEVMASGVFPIVADIPANRIWIQDGINGFLVPIDSPEVLADKIIMASQNRALRNSAKEKNLKIAQEHTSLQENSKKMEDIFINLTKNTNRKEKEYE